MAKIKLADGRTIPIVTPNLWDVAEVEKQTGWNRKKYAEMMKLSAVNTGVSIFASLRRAGVDASFDDCMNLDGIENLLAEPGDIAATEGEDEQSPDPQ